MPTPIVKWAGGKRQLLDEIEKRMPKLYNNYFEPFFGGGALFFNQVIDSAKTYYINDINKPLINLYRSVKDNPDELIVEISAIDNAMPSSKEAGKNYYQTKRAEFNKCLEQNIESIHTAALFLYINKHCFNGLYRLNKKGLFNVPWNTSFVKSFDETNLRLVSKHLSFANIQNEDFESALKNVSSGDFVFIDSPYAPLTDTSFHKYTAAGFGMEEQARLAKLYKLLDLQGAYLLATNHDTELIRNLYAPYKIERVSVRRSINSKGSARKGTEVIITNY